MKLKILVLVGTAVLSAGVFARPHGGWHPGPAPMHVHHHHHGGYWGRGGRHFWPGFVGGVVGGLVYNSIRPVTYVTTPTVVTTPTIVTTPTVVTTPVVTAPAATVQNVWVEGRYVDQIQANGTVIRVWQPGHYEQREVLLQ